jgi:hypothetical protein
MRLVARVGDPACAAPVDAGIRIIVVVIPQALPATRARRVEKDGELRVGHRQTVDREGRNMNHVRRPLVGLGVVAAHPEWTRRHGEHLFGGSDGSASRCHQHCKETPARRPDPFRSG